MTLLMDFRLASASARFGFVYTRRGIGPEGTSSWHRPSCPPASTPTTCPRRSPDAAGSAVRPWKNIWSAGQGVGSVDSVETVASLCDHLEVEYGAAMESLCRSLRKDADADRTR